MARIIFTVVEFVLFISVSLEEVNCQLCQNPIIGTDFNNTKPLKMMKPSFYLNTAHPAQCSGVGTSWRYCYHGKMDGNQKRMYYATLAVYRQTSNDEREYTRVSDIFTVSRSASQMVSGFDCDTLTVPSFDIQVGDVIGACVFDPPEGNERQLDIVGEVKGHSLMEMEEDGCSLDEIPQTISNNDLSLRNSRLLHVYANIGDPTTLSATEKPSLVPTATFSRPTTAVEFKGQDSVMTLSLEAIVGKASIAAVAVGFGVIIVVIISLFTCKRQRYTSGHYSPSGEARQTQCDTAIINDHVENLTRNYCGSDPGILELYDGVTQSQSVNTGEDIGYHEQLVESYYESVADNEDHEPGHNTVSGGFGLAYISPEVTDSKQCLSYLLERNKQEDIYGNLDAYYAPASDESEIFSLNSKLVVVTGHLGSGQFGIVNKGIIIQSRTAGGDHEVALKTLKAHSSDEEKVKFLQEAAIMAQFKHPNVVTLYGVVSNKEPLMLVVELMHRGDLRHYLISLKPDPGQLPNTTLPEMLLSFSLQVAFGMQYLSAKGFVHRDLAARNILVSRNNICKVADFGMSRDLADEAYYVSHGGMIPVKWTAPEAIRYKKYSTASDVWSYGCLLYEVWSLGSKPFEHVKNIEVLKLIDSNKRLPPPPGCPRTIYELMIKCWHPLAGNRPGFRELTIVLAGNSSDILLIPPGDALCTHKYAAILGNELEAEKDMYPDLKNKYLP